MELEWESLVLMRILCMCVSVVVQNGWNNGNNDDDAAKMNAEKTVIEY